MGLFIAGAGDAVGWTVINSQDSKGALASAADVSEQLSLQGKVECMIFDLEKARMAAKAQKLGEEIPLAAEHLLGAGALAMLSFLAQASEESPGRSSANRTTATVSIHSCIL